VPASAALAIAESETGSMMSLYHESGMAVARTVRMELGTSSMSKLLSAVSMLGVAAVSAGAARAVAARKRVARVVYCMIKRMWEYKDIRKENKGLNTLRARRRNLVHWGSFEGLGKSHVLWSTLLLGPH
jgi:hypothetical protein